MAAEHAAKRRRMDANVPGDDSLGQAGANDPRPEIAANKLR